MSLDDEQADIISHATVVMWNQIEVPIWINFVINVRRLEQWWNSLSQLIIAKEIAGWDMNLDRLEGNWQFRLRIKRSTNDIVCNIMMLLYHATVVTRKVLKIFMWVVKLLLISFWPPLRARELPYIPTNALRRILVTYLWVR